MPERVGTNDPEISGDEMLLRRLVPARIVPGENGHMRISSAAFTNEELSVLFMTLLRQQGRPTEDALAGHRDNSLCSITVALARELDQGVVYDTVGHDPAHGLVIGKKTEPIKSRFAREAKWVVPTRSSTYREQLSSL